MSTLGAVAGAVLLSCMGAVAIAASLLIGNGSQPLHCVAGAAARNPTVPDQRDPSRTITMPTNRTFAAIEDAEAFICLRVPYPRQTGDWVLVSVSAERSHSLAQFVAGKGYRSIDLFYRNATARTQFTLNISPSRSSVEGLGPPQSFSIGGIKATLRTRPSDSQGPAVFTLDWQQDGFSYIASGTGSFRAQDLLPTLESIR